MFKNLSQFYNSDIWKKFRLGIINERTNKEDGILYDELNGQPLVNSYDIVLHHVTPLTMYNVNDYNISLNPANIMVLSQKSHNEIHKRFGYCTQRKVYYVYGSPCSGKTTFVNNIKGNSDLIIDIDNLWQAITGIRYYKPNALKQNVFMLRDCLYESIKTRAGRWERAFIITGGAVKSIRMREIESFGAEEIFIDTSKEECLKRLLEDNTRSTAQKDEWKKYIEKWFNDFTE